MYRNCLLTAASEVYLFAIFTSPESFVKWSGIFQIHLLNQKSSDLNDLNQLTLEKRGHFWKFNNSRRIIKNTTGGPDTRDAHPDPIFFHFHAVFGKNVAKQECSPVGCVPAAH